jgi:general secretion pathway protein A
MYLSHYGLKRKPFETSPDPDFLWLGEKHREGLAILKYGILENKGFLLITGDVGTGKTVLIRAIEREVGTHSTVVTIPDPGMNLMDFYNFMAAELKMDRTFKNKAEFLIHFKQFLLENFSARKRVLLIIDEAQRVKQDLLEEIRLLSNIDLGGKALINIFLVGQSEFRAFLTQDENRNLRQRISVSYRIAPLTEDETRAYLKHRLQVAGTTREIFPLEASRAVYRHTRGYPRLINIICDHALMSGYAIGVTTLNSDIIVECAQELWIAIGADLPGAVAPAPPQNAQPAAATLPPPEANPQPRTARRALILAGFMAIVVAGWYVWGDAISDQLAGLGNGGKHREAKDTALVPSSAKLNRSAPPSPPSDTQSQKAEDASPPVEAKSQPAVLPSQEFTLTFTPGSAEISIYAQDVLSLVVNLLNDFPNAVAVIEGHTDSIGDLSLNKAISESRAAAAKNHLMRKGIAPARLSTVAMGTEKPLKSNDTPEGRSRNRRVVIRVVAAAPG